jgi:hypothetical protein
MDYYSIGKQTVCYTQVYKYRTLNVSNITVENPPNESKSTSETEEIINLKSKIHALHQENADLKKKLASLSNQPVIQVKISDFDPILADNWNKEVISELTKEILTLNISKELW